MQCRTAPRSLYVALKGRYNSKLGNAVYLSTRTAVKELGSYSHRGNVGRWFRELQYYGFTVMITGAHLGVEGRGKAPHWRLTEEWYLGEPPTRDYQRWDGTIFHEQKSPEYYKRQERRLAQFNARKKQNRGPYVQATLAHTSRPVVDHTFRPPPSGSGPYVQAIQPQQPGPYVQAITSLTTPMLETRREARGSADAGAVPPDSKCAGCKPAEIDWHLARREAV